MYEVVIYDDGVGLPETFAIQDLQSLGLQISRTLVESDLGGRFSLESCQGTRARITIPKSVKEDASYETVTHCYCRQRINYSHGFEGNAEEAGHTVVGEAVNGQKAVELAKKYRPDLVIMDVKMPNMDGITAAKLISAEKLAPVLLLTAFSQKELWKRPRVWRLSVFGETGKRSQFVSGH